MNVPHELFPLEDLDCLKVLELADMPAFAHDDHRFVLLLARYGQEHGDLPKPCKVVMMDRHHDGLAPRKTGAMESIRKLRESGITYPELFDLTKDMLSSLDDDWLRAGMELGMFSDAVVFGVDDRLGENPNAFVDHVGKEHKIWINGGLPGECLGQQGNLSDLARGYEVKPLWELLEWDVHSGSFGFSESAETILLSIDLDAFVMRWDDFTFAWRDEVWEKKFLEVSTHRTAGGWSGTRFVHALLGRTGMLTIAREPSHCGGEREMLTVFSDFNKFVFDGALGDIDA